MTTTAGGSWGMALGLVVVAGGVAALDACSSGDRREPRSEPFPSGAAGTPTAVEAGLDAAIPDSGMSPEDAASDHEPPAPRGWPVATRTWSGARAPALTITAGGQVLVGYALDHAFSVELDPASSPSPVQISTNIGSAGVVRFVPGPTGDGVTAFDASGHTYFLDGAVLVADAFPIGYPTVGGVSLFGTAARPIALVETNYQNAAFWLHAVALPDPGAPDLPPLSDTTLVAQRDFAASMYAEASSFLELAETSDTVTGLVVPSVAVPSASGYATEARWVRVSGGLSTGGYLTREAEGTFSLPIAADRNASWVGAHDLGGGKYALTWHQIPECACMVFDVMLAQLSVDAGGIPRVTGNAINVSDTPGQTDESDHPLVLPRADGSFYIAWRESAFGPRLALYDESFTRQWIIAPDQDLKVRLDDPIAAVVDDAGRLHLVATVMPAGTEEVRYWVIGD
ncbi:MAG: hypothetical protein JW751_07005 [Polyangiaceae bacterium]|nr:hypothetical protein [Polyangiaceae bacterium]